MRGGQCRKAGAVVWQWVPTFKEAVPPPPPGCKKTILTKTSVKYLVVRHFKAVIKFQNKEM